MICFGRRHYRVSLNIQNVTSTLQNCESRPLGVNVNKLICIRSYPSRSKLPTVVPLDFCLLNSRRFICNKSRLINEFIADHNIDLFALTEMWLRGDGSDLYYICYICPDGYVFHHVSRLHTTGGGVGVVLKNNVRAKIQVHESQCFVHLIVFLYPICHCFLTSLLTVLIMPLSFEGLFLFALMRHGLRMKLKLQIQRAENWKDDGTHITPKLIIIYTLNIVVW